MTSVLRHHSGFEDAGDTQKCRLMALRSAALASRPRPWAEEWSEVAKPIFEKMFG